MKDVYQDGATRYCPIPVGDSRNTKSHAIHNVKMESDGGLGEVCKWAQHMKDADPMAKNPHIKEQRSNRHQMKIKDTILDCVGNTPLVRCDNLRKLKLGADSTVNLLAKCEFRESCAPAPRHFC